MNKTQEQQLISIFQSYIDEIDDYNESKDRFISDFNKILSKKYGDTYGVIDYTTVRGAVDMMIEEIG